jgi:iron complex transport system substrate-binding protein
MSRIIIIYLFLLPVIIHGCSGKTGTEEMIHEKTNSNYIKYAERFEIQQKDGYSILTVIDPWQGAKNVTQKYFLVGYGTEAPAGVDSARIIRVPVKSIICMSTTYLSMIQALNEQKSIKGISGSDFLYDKELRDLTENNKIEDVGYDDNINKERVIQISPDLVMVYGIGSESAGYIGKLKELGIKIIYNADYLENDPLGKAEWIKVFGALYNKKKESDSIFSSISEQYEKLKAHIRENIYTRPTVFFGFPWKDTWYISPGNSYITRLISDAGGDYLWKDTKSDISMPFGLENVYVRAIRADFWLNSGSVGSRNEITAIDYRMGDFPSFKNGNIYNNNKRVTPEGGNDYWESGSLNPQIILKDIASILHHDLFPGYDLCFYKKIE